MNDANALYLAQQLRALLNGTEGRAAAARAATGAGVAGAVSAGLLAVIGLPFLTPLIAPLVAVSAAASGLGFLKDQNEKRDRPEQIRSLLDNILLKLVDGTREDRRPLLVGALTSLLLQPRISESELARLAASFIGRRGAARDVSSILHRLEQYGLVSRVDSHDVQFSHQVVSDHVREWLARQASAVSPEPGA